MTAWDRVFGDHDEVVRELGAVPADLVGSYVRNGPGRQALGDDRVNYFDANGLIAAVSLQGGRARLVTRHVRTALFAEEEAAKRQLRRRTFTNKPSRWANLLDTTLGNPASHDVVAWGGRVIATSSAGHWALDAATLATIGPEDWGGALPAGNGACPMPRVDVAADRIVAYDVRRGGARGPDTLTFHEFDASFARVRGVSHRLDTKGYGVHDLAFTPRWYVITELPSALSPLAALWGDATFYGAIAWDPGATALHLVARDGGGARRIVLPAPIRGAFHVVNAWEEGDDVFVELITGPDLPNVDAAYPPSRRPPRPVPTPPTGPRLVRVTPDDRAEVVDDFGGVVGDLPAVDRRFCGRRHRWTWLLSPGASAGEPDPCQQLWRHAITRVDHDGGVAVWDAGPDACCSPPGVAPVGDDEGGYVLTFVFDLRTGLTDLVVLPAADPAAGPVARVPLGVFVAPASHARFFPGVAIGEGAT